MLDTLNALWTGLGAVGISLYYQGADAKTFCLRFAPETGFTLPAGTFRPEELTLTAEGLADLLTT